MGGVEAVPRLPVADDEFRADVRSSEKRPRRLQACEVGGNDNTREGDSGFRNIAPARNPQFVMPGMSKLLLFETGGGCAQFQPVGLALSPPASWQVYRGTIAKGAQPRRFNVVKVDRDAMPLQKMFERSTLDGNARRQEATGCILVLLQAQAASFLVPAGRERRTVMVPVVLFGEGNLGGFTQYTSDVGVVVTLQQR